MQVQFSSESGQELLPLVAMVWSDFGFKKVPNVKIKVIKVKIQAL